jgi:hypothetical protein
MSNKFDPKPGVADGMPHTVTAGTLGGATSGRKGGLGIGGQSPDGCGALTSGNKMVGKGGKGAKSHAGYLGGSRGPGFAVVTK